MLSSPFQILILPVLFMLISNDERMWCYGGSKSPKQSDSAVVAGKTPKTPKQNDSAVVTGKTPKTPKQNDSSVVAGNELVFAHIIFRHGDRNPTSFYRTDPYKDPKYWKEGLGELTDKGKQRLFDLGKYLRRRYCNLLNNQTYSPDLIYVRSSFMTRTMQSAEAAMAGFFGQKKLLKDGNEKSNDTHKPIPVNAIPQTKDHLIFFPSDKCARYLKEKKNVVSSDAQKNIQKYRKLSKYLEEYTNETIKGLKDIYKIYDVLIVEKENNLTLGNWTKEVFHPGSLAKDMEDAVKKVFKFGTATKSLARLRSGFLVRDMLDCLTDKSQSKLTPNYSFYVYSGHDSTLSALLHCLELNITELVPYGACVLFELYKPVKGDHYVQLYYKNTTAEVINPINIPNCGTKCTLEQFRTIYQDIIPTGDFETECAIDENKK